MSHPSPDTWDSWLSDQLQKMEDVYRRDPDRIFSDYNREVKHVDGYSGRGLLELIQNADDAGLRSADSVDVLIELTDAGLFVANSGVPFSRDGINSLMLSDNSPKQFRKECIGYKGLGFRSVLNWSSDVIIHSGDISIGFSEQFAAESLDELRAENAEIDRKVRRYEQRGTSHPIATLSTPRLLSRDDVEDSRLEQAYQKGQRIRSQGYDTVICVPLFDRDGRKQVQKEINSLFEELTLFLRSIEELQIRSPERDEHWRIDRTDESVVIHQGEDDPLTWEIFKDKGQIPDEYCASSQTKDKYEIKIAIPEDFTRFESPSDLFVFFPTKVSFPFPMLAHATFQVTESRNHLTETDANRFVAERLASMMVKAAEKRRTRKDPWHALQTVSPTSSVGSTLSSLGAPEGDEDSFEELLRAKIATRSLVPAQDGSFITPAKTQRIHGDFDDLLEGELFDDICLYVKNRNVKKQLERLNVGYIEYTELRNRLESISDDLSVETRADFITRLIDNGRIKSESPPRLLIDGEGNTISSEQTTFLPPQGQSVSLPSWVPRQVLHPKLASELQSNWGLTSIRDLRVNLEPFNVREYNLSGLVQTVVAAANERVEANPDSEERWRKKMLQALWDLYRAGAEGVSLSNVSIIIPTRTGAFGKASSLYLTSEYPNGELVEQLYQSVAPESFVVDPEELEFCEDVTTLESFLLWLGVADKPRIERRKMDGSDFYEHVVETLDYPVKFENQKRETPHEIQTTKKDRLREVESVDRLEDILDNAHPYAILSWLTTISETLDTWRQEGDPDAVFEIKPKYHQSWKLLRGQSLPSYPLWLLQTTEWLPVTGGSEFKAPKTCSAASIAKDISPLIGYPAVDVEHPLFSQLGIDETAVATTLQKIGVTNTIAGLSWDAFYEILFELPDHDSDGEVAKRVYRTLLKDRDEVPPKSRRDEFIENGEMFGTYNGVEDYYPVTELRYTNTDSIPAPVKNRYPALMLDNRQGTEKVQQLFGVKGLTSADIDISNVDSERHPHAGKFKDEVKSLKPFIYAYRVDGDDNRRELQAIRDANVILCRSVSATASVNDDEFDIELEPGAYLLDDSTAYVVPESFDGFPRLHDDHLARLVGDVFSDILDKKLGKDILSLATASNRKRRLKVLLDDESAYDRLRESRAYLAGEIPTENTFSTPDVSDGMDRTQDGHSREEQGDDAEQSTTQSPPSPSESSIDESVEGVSADRRELDRIEGQPVTTRRVSQTSQNQSTTRSYNVPDAKGAEEIAYWFENDAGRFPMLVSHLQGSESYGCDVLSFNTEERREAFKSDPNRELIDRYIEVKSSTSQRGNVTLKNNQFKQATNHGEQFYLYRVYDGSSKGEPYELVVLRNPLKHQEAVTHKVSINPYHTDEAVRYSLDLITDDAD